MAYGATLAAMGMRERLEHLTIPSFFLEHALLADADGRRCPRRRHAPPAPADPATEDPNPTMRRRAPGIESTRRTL
jgi:hypothetical protein